MRKNIAISFVLLLGLFIQSCQKKDGLIISKEVEVIKDENGRYSFSSPLKLFKPIDINNFVAEKINAKIEFIPENIDLSIDYPNFKKSDIIDKYKKGLTSVQEVIKDDYFIIIGKDLNNKNIYIKGYYVYVDRVSTNEEKTTTGKQYVPISYSLGILKFEYSEDNKEDVENVLPVVMKSYKCELGNL